MLRKLRNQKKLLSFFLWLVIIAFVGTIFLVWGMGGKVGGDNYVIKVNDNKISYNEYQLAYENTSNTLRQLFGDNVEKIPEFKNLKRMVIDDLIERYLLIEEAEKSGVFVTDAEVLNTISSTKAFFVDGKFDRNRYIEVLRFNGMYPEAYEETLRKDILVSKMENLIKNAVEVTKQEIEKEYAYRNTTAVIKYLSIDPNKYRSKVSFTDEDLKAFFEENKEDYRIPEKIKVKYVVFDEDNFDKDIVVTDEEAEAYFLQHKEQFHQSEQVEARHILVRVNDFENKEENEKALSKINKARDEIKKGAAFEKVAENYSEDISAKNGGYLGFFKRGEMVKEFEEAAFKLEPGQVSDIVKSPFGYHIIKVEKKLEEKDLSFDEVKERIIERIKEEKEKNQFKNYVYETYKDILTESNISAYLTKHPGELSVYETDYFTKGENIPPFRENDEVKNIIFNLEVAEVSPILDIDGKKYIVEVSDKKASYIPNFEEVKELVKKDYIDKKAIEYAKNLLEDEVNTEKAIEDISKKLKVSYTTTPPFKRIEPIDEIGSNSEITNDIFATKQGLIKKVYIIDGKPSIIHVEKVEEADLSKLPEEEEEIKLFLLSIKQEEAYKDYINSLKNKASIKIAPGMLD
jgi:peptidyl-prolyl cis-trans isomerase D